MVRVSPAARSASSGEMSELMFGRPDFDRYQNGARTVRGFIPLPEGPLTRCPGTEVLGETASSNPGRFMSFIFRDEDAVLLEWTSALLRFWRNGALIEDGGEPYSIAQPYGIAGIKRLQSLQSGDRIYLTEGQYAPRRLSRFGLTDWTIETTPFVNGPFRARNLDQTIEIKTSGSAGTIDLEATGDIFFDGQIGTLFRLQDQDTGDTPSWTGQTDALVGDQFYNNGRVYRIAGFDRGAGVTGPTEPNVNSQGNVVWFGDVAWIGIAEGNDAGVPVWAPGLTVNLGDRLFADGFTIEMTGLVVTDAGTGVNPPVHLDGLALSEKGGPIWQFLSDGSGTVRILTVTSPRTATARVVTRLPDSLNRRPTYRWSEAAWSDYRGWPRAIGAYQQRHIYGGSPDQPRTIWTSVIGGTVDMTATGEDDSGFSFILPPPIQRTGEIRTIRAAGKILHIGTSGDEMYGAATDADRAFAAQTSRFDSDTSIGCADTDPLIIDGQLVFLHKNKRRLIRLTGDADTAKFRGENLTQIARHILGGGVDRIVYQEEPIPVVWARGLDGRLIGLTFIPSAQVLGWHTHDLAGGAVEDIEVMPTDDGLSEALHLIVRRTIGGVSRRFHERMQPPFVELDGAPRPMEDAWFQYCAVRYQGVAASTLSGLDHLEGETVTSWTNLGAFTDLVVTGGAVTLPDAVTSAITGLDATDRQVFETLDIVVGQPDGGDEGRLRTHRVTGVRVHKSAAGAFSVVRQNDGVRDETRPQPLFNLREFELPKLRDGVFEIAGHKAWGLQTWLKFTPSPGAPLTIVSRTPTLMITDD